MLAMLAFVLNALVPVQAHIGPAQSITGTMPGDLCSARLAGNGDTPDKKLAAGHRHCADCVAGSHLLGPRSERPAMLGVAAGLLGTSFFAATAFAPAKVAHATPGARAPPLSVA